MKIIGHRGARGLAPENTIAGLRKGLEHHVDAIEIDVRITKDSQPVLSHDALVTDPAGNALDVHQHTLAELRAHRPDLTTLSEAIEAVDQAVPLIIEVKPQEDIEPIVQVIRTFVQRGWQPSNLCFISFDFKILQALKKEFPDHLLIVDEMWSGIRAAWRARRLGTKHISLAVSSLWPGYIMAVSRSGYYLYGFSANDVAKAKRWARYGFYGAITDYPDLYE